MLPTLLRFSQKPALDFLIKLVISLLLICLLAPLEIAMTGEVPITMQTFIILFCSISFGPYVGGTATILYILAGVLGLPVFAGYSSGIEKIMGPHGGFFFGFVIAAVVTGYLAGLEAFRKPLSILLLWVTGHALIMLFGILWLSHFIEDWPNVLQAIQTGAIIKSAVGALVTQLLIRVLKGRSGFYEKKRPA